MVEAQERRSSVYAGSMEHSVDVGGGGLGKTGVVDSEQETAAVLERRGLEGTGAMVGVDGAGGADSWKVGFRRS